MARGQLRIDQPGDKAPQKEVTEALAAYGLVAIDHLDIEETFALWPENAEVLRLWFEVETQWQYGPRGKTGISYAGVEADMRLRRISQAKRAELFAGLKIMEVAALNEWATHGTANTRGCR